MLGSQDPRWLREGREESKRSGMTLELNMMKSVFGTLDEKMGNKRRDVKIDSKHESYNFNASLESPLVFLVVSISFHKHE